MADNNVAISEAVNGVQQRTLRTQGSEGVVK